MHESFPLCRSRGRLGFVGLFQGDVTFNDPDFHRRELTLYASRNSRPQDFTRIIGMMESGVIDTSPWITHRLPIANLPESFPPCSPRKAASSKR